MVEELNTEQRRFLMKMARQVAECTLENRDYGSFDAEARALHLDCQCGGCFVTYKNHGKLRGCIGCFSPDDPLYKVVISRAKASLYDSRFHGISLDEFRNNIDICISVLTSPVSITDPLNEVKVGVHGIIVKKGYNSGTYLPQVATEQGWDVRTFVTHCAYNKAGISSPDVLNDPQVKWQTYTALLVYEADFSREEIRGTP
ncbi:AMMECR1 protein [Pelomyxa schiedti]|nr:AMMECR1 protein [Pelomyxa schiedti]